MITCRLHRSLVSLFLAAVFCVGVGAPSQASWEWATGPALGDEEGKRDWGIEVVPYLWLSSLDGELALPPGGTIPVSSSFSGLASNLDAGFAGSLDLRYRRWHLISDNSWVRLKMEGVPEGPILTSATLRSELAFGTVGIAYELPIDRSFALDVYLAARWWHITTEAVVEATLGPGLTGAFSETWADAIVGGRIRYAITDRWRVTGVVDIGGGAASLDWGVFGSVGYDFNDHLGLTVGYRILGVDYSNEGFAYDMRQSGLLLGFNLRY